MFKKNEMVEFTVGRRVYRGRFVRRFHPAPKAGPHYRVNLESGIVATFFAKGPAGKSMKKVSQ